LLICPVVIHYFSNKIVEHYVGGLELTPVGGAGSAAVGVNLCVELPLSTFYPFLQNVSHGIHVASLGLILLAGNLLSDLDSMSNPSV
jgi:hypothetical protein